MSQKEEKEWERIMSANNGLSCLYTELVRQGVSKQQLVKSHYYIVKVLEMLPLLEGTVESEFHDLFCKKIEEMNAAKIQYETKLDNLPERERRAELKYWEYENKRKDVSEKESHLYYKEQELKCLEKKLEERKAEIDNVETPEGKDKMRLANFYLSQVEQNQWTDKAIAWSLGAILSGTQIPNFGKS